MSLASAVPPDPPAYTDADFAAALSRLLPRGRAWPRDPDAVLMQVMTALAPGFARLHARANRLVADAFPGTTAGLLPEWEATLGLPDPCAGAEPTTALRRRQVVARIGARGGQSVPYMVALAAALGFEVTVEEFAPSEAGRLCCGEELADDGWAHVWRVVVQNSTVEYAYVGEAETPFELATWGNRVLECELSRVAPAHTVLLFGYAPAAVTGAAFGDFVFGRNALV